MKLIVAWVLILSAGVMAGCGEPSQNVLYEGGQYAGKPDAPAWESDAFAGDRDEWNLEIKKRSRMQSEYTRLKGGA